MKTTLTGDSELVLRELSQLDSEFKAQEKQPLPLSGD